MQPAATQAVMPLEEAVWVDAGRLSGEPCFRGTRVPVQNLWDYVRGGYMLAEFYLDFPSVSPEQVSAVLVHAEQHLATRF